MWKKMKMLRGRRGRRSIGRGVHTVAKKRAVRVLVVALFVSLSA